MDRSVIDELLELSNETDRAALAVLYNAWVKKFEAYRRDDSKANLTEWQAAEKVLRAKVDELSSKHLDAPGTRTIANTIEAWRYLQAEGYKVGKQTVYNAARDGKLIVQADGTVTQSDALAYAAKNLKKAAGNAKGGKAGKLADDRAEEELALTRTRRERMQFEYERERGKYMLKTDVRTEIAIKIAAFEGGVKHMFRTSIADWIHMVGGDPNKSQMLLTVIYAEFDQVLDDFGRMEDIGVIVARSSGDEQPLDDDQDGGIFAMDIETARKEPADGIVGDA